MSEPHLKDKFGYCPDGYAESRNCVQCVAASYETVIQRVRELHKPVDVDGTLFCQSCDRCWACVEWGQNPECDCNDLYPCKTIRALDGEE